MKKNFIYILPIIILLILSFFKKNDNLTFEIDGIKYAVSVNGTEQASFPTKGSYTVTTNCTNADSKWNYQKWGAEVCNITGDVTCNISFTQTSKVTFANKIIGLLGSNTSVSSESTAGNESTLEKINSTSSLGTSTDYRYRGVNPANYVMFNNELWRIIGVFDSTSHGITSTNLVKLIRMDSIGTYVFDNTENSTTPIDYANTEIYNLLNQAYYNTTSVTAAPLDASGQDYCISITYGNGVCDFTKIGVQPEYKRMVEDEVTWYSGNSSRSSKTTILYENERKETAAVAPIGLMYASDYGYAAPAVCIDTAPSSFSNTCVEENWLKSNYFEWTMTLTNGGSGFAVFPSALFITQAGDIDTASDYFNCFSYDTRPVLYLDASVYYLSGTGTQVDPYIIAMD